MAFLNPWALAMGIVAAALPVLIHWLTRPRPVVRPLSTLRFVLRVVQQRRARNRLRDFLILLVRTAAVLLLALAFARPTAGRRARELEEAVGDATRVVLLDVSQSMAARAGGIRAFERARSLAATYLAGRPGLTADLVLAGASPRAVFGRPSRNLAALRETLGRSVPVPERLDVQAALNTSARILEGPGRGPNGRLELIVLSDFQRSQWAVADFAVLPRETTVRLEFVAPAESPPNLALLRVGGSGRAEQGRPMTVEVDVGNFSPASRRVEVEVTLDAASFRLEGTCSPRARTTLSTELVPRTAGWQAGKARLLGVEDALAEDDARPFAIDVRTPPTYALVTRQGTEAQSSSSYFLERALVPQAARDDRPAARVVRFDPAQPDREALAGADLVVFDHPGRLPDDLLAPLVGWLRRGRGLLYVASEPADASNLGRIADLAGADLRMPVAFAPAPPGGARGARFIAEFRRDAAPFQVFGDEATEALAPLRFPTALATRPLPDALADDLRASYGDRTACLVVSACGAGTLAVLNADLEASNLPTAPAFVPLVGELATLLLGRRSIEPPVACGEPFAVPLPADAGPLAGLSVVPGSQSKADRPELAEESEGVVCRVRAAGPPGVTRIERGGRTVFALAAAIPDQESDLTVLAPSVFRERLAGGRRISSHDLNQPEDQADVAWAWLAVGCVLCLAAELVLLRAFRT